MDDTRDVTEDGQTDVDEQVGTASAFQEDADRGQEDGEDDFADISGNGGEVVWLVFLFLFIIYLFNHSFIHSFLWNVGVVGSGIDSQPGSGGEVTYDAVKAMMTFVWEREEREKRREEKEKEDRRFGSIQRVIN